MRSLEFGEIGLLTGQSRQISHAAVPELRRLHLSIRKEIGEISGPHSGEISAFATGPPGRLPWHSRSPVTLPWREACDVYIGSHSCAFRRQIPPTYLTRLAEDRSDLLSEAKRPAAAAKNPDTGKRRGRVPGPSGARIVRTTPCRPCLAVPDSPPLTFGGATEDFSRRLYQYETRHSRDWSSPSRRESVLKSARAAAIGTPEPELKVDADCAIGLAGRDVGDSAVGQSVAESRGSYCLAALHVVQ